MFISYHDLGITVHLPYQSRVVIVRLRTFIYIVPVSQSDFVLARDVRSFNGIHYAPLWVRVFRPIHPQFVPLGMAAAGVAEFEFYLSRTSRRGVFAAVILVERVTALGYLFPVTDRVAVSVLVHGFRSLNLLIKVIEPIPVQVFCLVILYSGVVLFKDNEQFGLVLAAYLLEWIKGQ